MPAEVIHEGATGPRGERVLVRRSARRTRTVSITRRDGDLVVAIPATFSRREEREWVQRMIERLQRQEARRGPIRRGDDQLEAWARELSETFLDGRARPTSVRWSTRQLRRWGSCTPSSGQIRLSTQMQQMPAWVIRGVLLHELVHLLEPGHGPRFRALLERSPEAVRAEAFLEGVSWARDMPPEAAGIDED